MLRSRVGCPAILVLLTVIALHWLHIKIRLSISRSRLAPKDAAPDAVREAEDARADESGTSNQRPTLRLIEGAAEPDRGPATVYARAKHSTPRDSQSLGLHRDTEQP